jgi:hypothetical protein
MPVFLWGALHTGRKALNTRNYTKKEKLNKNMKNSLVGTDITKKTMKKTQTLIIHKCGF